MHDEEFFYIVTTGNWKTGDESRVGNFYTYILMGQCHQNGVHVSPQKKKIYTSVNVIIPFWYINVRKVSWVLGISLISILLGRRVLLNDVYQISLSLDTYFSFSGRRQEHNILLREGRKASFLMSSEQSWSFERPRFHRRPSGSSSK